MNDLHLLEMEYKRELAQKGKEDGYLMVDRMFIEIGKSKRHHLSLKSALEFVDFYGYNGMLTSSGKMGFVGRAAYDAIGRALEQHRLIVKE